MHMPKIIEQEQKSLATRWADVLCDMEARRDLIEAALEYADGTHTYDDVVEMVMSGRLFWKPLPNSFMIFEIVTFPRQRHFHGFLAGGDLQEIRASQPELEELARLAGCSIITLSGRRGWVRALQDLGWEEACVTLSLPVHTQTPTVENYDGEKRWLDHSNYGSAASS